MKGFKRVLDRIGKKGYDFEIWPVIEEWRRRNGPRTKFGPIDTLFFDTCYYKEKRK